MTLSSSHPDELYTGAIVLMAGLSQRLPEQNKLLLKIGGQSIASKTIENLEQAGFSPIIVITGHEASLIRESLREHQVHFIHNEVYEEGMGSSIRAAMKGVKAWDGALIAMGDMPFVSIEILQKIRAKFLRNPQGIIAPIFGSRRGQPVLFSAHFFPELAQCGGDIGGRDIIKRNEKKLHLVPVTQKSIFWDVDTLNDMNRYKKELEDE